MFKRILVANRGEIALRIIRTCQDMGIETVAIYSVVDKNSLHVQVATCAYCIGPAISVKSYLNFQAIIDIALKTECEAIHPGYGFLSENAEFAEACNENGIKFIGPTAKIIREMSNKVQARSLMEKEGVPIVPGSKSLVNECNIKEIADKIGYPILIKASSGGGGKGMRRVFNSSELLSSFKAAQAEAMSSFGNNEIYIEKLVLKPKHIEFQILADAFGNIIHFGERDCSIQRNNQKIIEECPSIVLSSDLRAEMGEVAVRAAKAVNYEGVGTIEFILDSDNHYYFIEMNTRIQVEHPVTEMVFGIDLIRGQILVAAGFPINYDQSMIKAQGWAIECRINAENPYSQFIPSVGKIDFVHLPGGIGVRVDSFLYSGIEITPYYDSMIGKIIAFGANREEALKRIRRALNELMLEGIITNAEFLSKLIDSKEYIEGSYTTKFVNDYLNKFGNLNR